MYQKILVPMALDHDISPKTLAIAQSLCGEGGAIIALHVHEAPQGSVRAYLDDDTIAEGLKKARADMDAKLSSTPGVTGELVSGHTARTIVDYADSHGVDCIVIGSHKPGLGDYFLGSTASRVVRHASCAVHVHRTE